MLSESERIRTIKIYVEVDTTMYTTKYYKQVFTGRIFRFCLTELISGTTNPKMLDNLDKSENFYEKAPFSSMCIKKQG